jgi:hypothetical protein
MIAYRSRSEGCWSLIYGARNWLGPETARAPNITELRAFDPRGTALTPVLGVAKPTSDERHGAPHFRCLFDALISRASSKTLPLLARSRKSAFGSFGVTCGRSHGWHRLGNRCRHAFITAWWSVRARLRASRRFAFQSSEASLGLHHASGGPAKRH